LFQQARPAARIVSRERDWTPEALDAAIRRDFVAKFADLSTDLEAFNTDPVV
jgi:hypothetical protein